MSDLTELVRVDEDGNPDCDGSFCLYDEAHSRIEQLERENEELKSESAIASRHEKANAKMLYLAQEECDDWKHKKFARFVDDECWLFADDGEDNLHSLICPVVMSKDKAIELVEARQERDEMAAHIERLEDEITGIINDSVGVAGYHMNGDIASWQEFDIENILEQSPKTSLAEHDAEVIQRFLHQEAPLINSDGLDSDEHCCECILHDERVRLHKAAKIRSGKDCE